MRHAVEALLRDLRLAARSLAKTPGFTASAVLSLALATGATTAILGAARAILFKPVPGHEPARLVNLHRTARDGSSFHGFSYPDLLDLRAGARAFSSVAGFTGRFVTLRDGATSDVVAAQAVTGNYFETLGVAPLFGRGFGAADERPDASGVLLSERLWRKRFGADASVVGRAVFVNGRACTVAGVMPASFTGTFVGFTFDAWIPLAVAAASEPAGALTSHDGNWLELFARLSPGATLGEARASTAVLASALSRAHPKRGEAWGIDVRPMTPVDDSVRRVVTRLFALLLGVSGLVLAIASVNVAGLLLARGTARRRELAIRQAIGASRPALVRQLLVETLVLFAAGAVLGAALAHRLAGVLAAFAPKFAVPLELDLAPDLETLGAALAIALLAALLAGAAPAVRAARVEVLDGLRDAPGNARTTRGRGFFVAGQIAASMLLLVLASLLVRSVDAVRRADPGFEPSGLWMARLTVPPPSDARAAAFFAEVSDRAAAIPGVASTALVREVPLGGFGGATSRVTVDGVTTAEGLEVVANVISPRALETLRIPLLSGRDFRASDDARAPRVAIVNESFAARLGPGGAPGRTFRDAGELVTIVGVARNAKYRSLTEEPRLAVYYPLAQRPSARMTVLLRAAPGAAPTGALREVVRRIDPDLPVLDAMPVSDFIAVSFLPHRTAGAVTTALGLLGLLLASVGLHGVVSYTVGRRTREIGIRVALGARRGDVLGLVLGQTALLAGGGILAGALASAASARLLRGFLFGVGALDPLSFGAAAAALALVAVAASAVPARRALSVDPLLALRSE